MAGFDRPEKFDAWKLAWELKDRIVAFTATQPADRDRRFCDEIRESARSAPDNAHSSRYLCDNEFHDLSRLCRRAIGACTGLQLYLKSLPKDFDPRKHSKKDLPKPPEPNSDRT